LCRIPRDNHRQRNISVRELLKASGYLDYADAAEACVYYIKREIESWR